MRLRQRTHVVLAIAILLVSTAFYGFFDRFLLITGEEIVKAWFHGDFVALQEGQIYSSIAKNQSVFQKSPFIRSVVLVDATQPDKHLFSVGKQKKDLTEFVKTGNDFKSQPITSFRTGFLSNTISVALPGKNKLFLVYDISSSFLIWAYLGTVALGILFVAYLILVTKGVADKERKKRDQVRSDLFRRLSHDINSPLLSVTSSASRVKKLDYQLYLNLEKATESIRKILAQTDKVNSHLSTQLPTVGEGTSSAFDMETEFVPFAPILSEWFQVKKTEYSHIENMRMEFVGLSTIAEVFVEINVDEFKRHFSNILKNAVEATSGNSKPEISISATKMSDMVVFEIKDNGHGIPKHLIGEIGKKGVSLGKSNGQGLGLYFAIATIKYWKGFTNIHSEQGEGTTISISLPSLGKANWYKSTVNRDSSKRFVFVDDDETMESRWRSHFNLENSDYYFFSSAEQFRTWFNSGGQFEDSLEFYFDYHLDSNNIGLEIINELGIYKESTMVTSAYLDKEVVGAVSRAHLKIIPKVFIGGKLDSIIN